MNTSESAAIVTFVPQVMDWAKRFPVRKNKATKTANRLIYGKGIVIRGEYDVKVAVMDGELAVKNGINRWFIIELVGLFVI